MNENNSGLNKTVINWLATLYSNFGVISYI